MELSKAQLDQIQDGLGLDRPELPVKMEPSPVTRMAREAMERQRKAKNAAKARASYRRRKRGQEIIDATNADIPVEKLTQEWRVVTPMYPVIQAVADAKRVQASQLGSDVVGDIAQEVTMSMLRVVAQADFPIDEMAGAAWELADQGLPREQSSKVRKWLMSVVNRLTSQAIYDLLTAPRDMSLDDERHAEAVAHAVLFRSEQFDRFCAFGGMKVAGAHFPAPGRIDWSLIAFAVADEITRRRLDAMCEVILANLRSDGTCAWKAAAPAVFAADVDGAWETVVALTRNSANPEDARGLAARRRARALFAWLPDVISEAIDVLSR